MNKKQHIPPLYVELSDKDKERLEDIKKEFETSKNADAIRLLIREKHKEIEEKGGSKPQ